MTSTDISLSVPTEENIRRCYRPDCGKPLERRQGETQQKFLKRLHCDKICSETNPLLNAKRAETFRKRREAVPKRTCVVCSKKFGRTKNENTKKYLEREICSRRCSATKRSQDRKQVALSKGKTCQNILCGKTFYRNVGKETPKKFSTRKTCCTACGHKSRLKDPHSGPRRRPSAEKTTKKSVVSPESTLPPVQPLKRKIPDPPKPITRTIWRPEAWGGEYTVQVG